LRPYHPQTSSFQPPPSLPANYHTANFPSSDFYSFEAPGIHGPSLQDPTRNGSNEGINLTAKASLTPNQIQTLLEAAPVPLASPQPFRSQPPTFHLSTHPSEPVLSDPSPMPRNPSVYTSSTQPEQNSDSVPSANQSLDKQPSGSTAPTNNPSYVMWNMKERGLAERRRRQSIVSLSGSWCPDAFVRPSRGGSNRRTRQDRISIVRRLPLWREIYNRRVIMRC
jgi:hypothetical protein